MKWRVMVFIVLLLLFFILPYLAATFLTPSLLGTDGGGFRGPVGAPSVKGPAGPPPSP